MNDWNNNRLKDDLRFDRLNQRILNHSMLENLFIVNPKFSFSIFIHNLWLQTHRKDLQ